MDGKPRVKFLYFYWSSAAKRQEENLFHSVNHKLSSSPYLIVPNVIIEAKYSLSEFISFSYLATFLTFSITFFSFVTDWRKYKKLLYLQCSARMASYDHAGDKGPLSFRGQFMKHLANNCIEAEFFMYSITQGAVHRKAHTTRCFSSNSASNHWKSSSLLYKIYLLKSKTWRSGGISFDP